MEESGYLANVLRERACGLCGADRRRVVRPVSTTCAICHATTDGDEALFAVGGRAARPVCGAPCLEVALSEGLVDGDVCPLCGSLWADARLTARSCASCAASLRPEGSYAGLWRAGRLYALCGAPCLDAFRGRRNPFCG